MRGALPKELLEIAGRSLLAHALGDLAAGGVLEALVVVSRSKREALSRLGSEHAGVRLRYVEQDEPRGLADALALADRFCADAPFVGFLPDNLWRGEPSMTAQLVAAHARVPDLHLVGLIELPAADLDSFGRTGFVESEPIGDDGALRRVRRVHAKGERPEPDGDRVLKGFPLVLWQPDLFSRIERSRARARESSRAGELDDTPILQELAREGRLGGVVLRGGRLFDCGIPNGYGEARRALG